MSSSTSSSTDNGASFELISCGSETGVGTSAGGGIGGSGGGVVHCGEEEDFGGMGGGVEAVKLFGRVGFEFWREKFVRIVGDEETL